MTPDELRSRLQGPMTVLLTPFRGQELDLAALERHVEFQIEHGIPVLVACGTISEAAALSPEEQHAVVETTVRAVAGRCAVLAGVAEQRPEDVERLVRHAAGVGADGLLVMLPPSFRLTLEEQWAFCRWLDGTSELPYVLYSTPQHPNGPLAFQLLERLPRLEHLAAIKEAGPDVARFRSLVRRFGDRLPFVAAAEVSLPFALMAGAVGSMTATSCFAPGLMWEIFRAARSGDVKRLLAHYEPIARFRALFQDRMDAGYPAYLPFTKAACELVGLPTGGPRLPLMPVSEHERQAVARVLREAFDVP